MKLTSPDYTDCDKETALQDFLQRIDHYKACYQTIDEVQEAMLSFIKIFNAGERERESWAPQQTAGCR